MISVIIPLYNGAQFIRRAIDSVLSQTFADFEVVVVNDGSTDEGPAIVNSYADKRISLVHKANGGVSSARNQGAACARSEWVSFLDCDDEYRPEFLEKMHDLINSFAGEGIVMAAANYYIEELHRPAVRERFAPGLIPYFSYFRRCISPNHTSSTVVKKAAFLEVGGFPLGIQPIEDWILFSKLAYHGKFAYTSELLSVYHSSPGSCVHGARKLRHVYEGAALFGMTIEALTSADGDLTRRAAARRACSEVCASVAINLSRNGMKRESLRLLRYVYMWNFSRHGIRLKAELALRLLCPAWFRQIARS